MIEYEFIQVLISVNKEEFLFPSVMCTPWVKLKEELEVQARQSKAKYF